MSRCDGAKHSLVPVFCGRAVDARSEARPPCPLECVISTVGKHQGQRSFVRPLLTTVMFPTNALHQLITPYPEPLSRSPTTLARLDDSVSHTLV